MPELYDVNQAGPHSAISLTADGLLQTWPQSLVDTAVAAPPMVMPETLPSRAIAPAPALPEMEHALEPRVRPVNYKDKAARERDIDALTQIELAAYHDVYGVEPDTQIAERIRRTYQERVELLGKDGLILVLEDTNGTQTTEPYGMIVCTRTDLNADAFLAGGQELDMTDNTVIRQTYNARGRNGYIVNFAVAPGHDRHAGYNLLMHAIQMGIERGVRNVFFESRLPDHEGWVTRLRAQAATLGEPIPDTQEANDILADIYWKLTRGQEDPATSPAHADEPYDRLLRYYVTTVNAQPLGLIKEAWKPDHPSLGYGVLCQVELPVHDDEAAAQLSLSQRTIEWAKHHPLEVLALGAGAVGLTFIGINGQEAEIIDRVQHGAKPWAIAYAASLAMYVATGAAGAVGGLSRGVESLGRRTPFIRDWISERQWNGLRSGSNWLIEKALMANFFFALVAAAALTGGIHEAIPEGPSQTAGYVLVAADATSTIALRTPLVRMLRRSRTRTPTV